MGLRLVIAFIVFIQNHSTLSGKSFGLLKCFAFINEIRHSNAFFFVVFQNNELRLC